jgi:hypothetical protein
MKSFLVCAIGAAVFVCSGTELFAQKKSEAKLTKADIKYREESDAIRKTVWSWNKPEFAKRNIPAEHANASKVVIARHTELSADSKSKLVYYGLGFGSKKETSILETVREMVKVNDKPAVEEYSELSFTRLVKISGLYTKARSSAYVGVRVIKPNGQVKEINADDIVFTKNETDEKKAKLAIPDLQPGDIIDYFIATDQLLTNDFSVKPYTVVLFDDAPVLHYSFHGQLGKKFAIDYRSYNGAPDLKVTKNEDDDIVIDVEKKNMPSFETSLWVAPALQLPFIRMNISLGYRGIGSKYLGASKPGEVNKNKDTDEVLEQRANSFASQFYSSYFMRAARAEFEEVVDDAKKKAKQAGLNFNDMSDDEKAAQLYYTLRFSKLLNFNIDELERSLNVGQYSFNGLAFLLNCTFKAADLEPAILVTTARNGFRMKEAMDPDDFVSAAYLMGSNKIFSIQSVYDIPFAIPQELEGVKNTSSIKLRSRTAVMSAAQINKMAEVGPGMRIPATDASKNAHLENLSISVVPGQNNLTVQRKTVLKGHYKHSAQKYLILYEDFYEAERKALGEKKSLIEKLEDGRKSKKFVDEVKNAFSEARTKQKDAFTEEAKSWFEQDVTEMKNYKIEKMGVRHTDPDFVYSSSFNLDGFVKKAGNNLIVEIGKIQGTPLTIKPEQRKRALDIYMDFPRSVEYHVELNIPEGYTAEGVDALNKKVVNETGFFTAEAAVNGSKIDIKVKKHYLHAAEPAANWEKMMEFLDAAVEWTNAKILFKKK